MRARYGAIRAVTELKSIFACQWRNGMLPQIRFVPGSTGYRPDADDWGVTAEISGQTRYRTSGITQPPIIGLCAERVFERLTDWERGAFLADFLMICGGLERYHKWLLAERDPKKEKLVVCLHPWETGLDNSPAFESLIDATRSYLERSDLSVDSFGRADTQHVAARQRPTNRDYYAYFGLLALFKKHGYKESEIIAGSPFLLQDVLFNTLLAASLGATARLMEALAELDELPMGQGTGLRREAQASREEGEAVAGAIRGKMWHDRDRLFYGYDLRSGKQLDRVTIASLMPLLSEIATTEQAEKLLAHLGDEASFATPVPVPSTPANSPAFDRQRYWSGPSWPVTNWLLIEGLRDRQPVLAETLRIATIEMIREVVALDEARVRSMGLMERNSVRGEFTTPSGKQYAHAWLWDSAIVAMAWLLVTSRPRQWQEESQSPGFWEYYDPFTAEPLGAKGMTWTAALLLELMEATESG